MPYEINVSLNGRHYFATAPRSLTTSKDAVTMTLDFIKRFPATDGFKISVSYNPERSWEISLDGTETDQEIKDGISGLYH
jgi:hypothetical protein